MNKRFAIVPFLFFSIVLFAQVKPEPLIPVEVLFGNERVNFSLSVNKSVNKPIVGKLRYINTLYVASYYDYRPRTTEMVTVNSLVYQFHKNIGVSTGMQFHYVKGFIPNVAIHFSYANPIWLLTFTPYYNFLPWSDLEVAGIVEFKPALSENVRLFTRLQGFYGHNLETNERERGMVYFRIGVNVKKYIVGFGGNIDYYTSIRPVIQNYGGFLRVNI